MIHLGQGGATMLALQIYDTMLIGGSHFTNYIMHSGLWLNGQLDGNSYSLYNSI
jgi:hypothetical protein